MCSVKQMAYKLHPSRGVWGYVPPEKIAAKLAALKLNRAATEEVRHVQIRHALSVHY